MAINFPDTPSIGDEFTGGGFTWTWSGTSWEKVTSSSIGTGFNIIVESSANTTYTFSNPQPAGEYSISSQLDDSTFDVYLVSPDNQSVGYTNNFGITATSDFNRIVIYGATTGDKLEFEYKPLVATATSGDVVDGAAPFLTSATPTTLESIDDTTSVTGGNFASDVEIVFVGQDAVSRPAKSVVRSSSTSLIVTRPDVFPPEQEPYSMIATNSGISNPSTNANRLLNYFDAGSSVVWVTSAVLPEAVTGIAYSTTIQATDQDALGVAYSITSGSLPSGFSLNGATGVISGTTNVVANSVFVVTAVDSGGNAAGREFSINAALPSLDFLVVAGGGAGGRSGNDGVYGGGGAGGYRAFSGVPIQFNYNYPLTIGAGGGENSSGSPSNFDTYQSAGGGRGAGYNISPGSGGSGGGFGGAGNVPATIPPQGNDGLSSGQGGGIGEDGNGIIWPVTGRYYAGGGRRSGVAPGTLGGGGAGNFSPGAQNTGGGGGSGFSGFLSGSAPGGSGIVILRYPAIYSATISAGIVSTTVTQGVFKITTCTSGTGTFRLVG